jgi:hypothetical protein
MFVSGRAGPRRARWFASLMLLVFAGNPVMASEGCAAKDLVGKWAGSFEQDSHETTGSFAMVLTVDQVSGEQFTGRIDWPDNDNRTRVEGGCEGDIVKWTETKYLRGDDVVLYGLYIAHFRGRDEIAGDWMDPKHNIYPKGPKYGTIGGSFILRRQTETDTPPAR